MRTATTLATVLVRVTGLIQLVLGILFWSGHARALTQLHMAIGMIFVLALWTLSVLGMRAGLAPGITWGALAWGIVLPVLGMTQMQILPGAGHWVVRVVHLLTAMVAMGLAQRLATGIEKSPGRPPLRAVHT